LQYTTSIMVNFIHKYYTWIFLGFLVLIVGLAYYLGYQQGRGGTGETGIIFSCSDVALQKSQISALPDLLPASVTSIEDTPTPSSSSQSKGAYVGSKNGTKYYTPGCSGTNRIKPENYVWFQSVEDATLQGYSKGSC